MWNYSLKAASLGVYLKLTVKKTKTKTFLVNSKSRTMIFLISMASKTQISRHFINSAKIKNNLHNSSTIKTKIKLNIYMMIIIFDVFFLFFFMN